MTKKTVASIILAITLGVATGLYSTYNTWFANAQDGNSNKMNSQTEKPQVLEQLSQEEALKKVEFKHKIKTLKKLPFENRASANSYSIGNNETVYDVDFFGKEGENVNLSIINSENIETIFPEEFVVKSEKINISKRIVAEMFSDENISQLIWSEDELTYKLTLNTKALNKIEADSKPGKFLKLYNQLEKF
jgi:hypothetical protein